MNIREALDRLGADENAPEGSQAWTLAEIGRQVGMLGLQLNEYRVALREEREHSEELGRSCEEMTQRLERLEQHLSTLAEYAGGDGHVYSDDPPKDPFPDVAPVRRKRKAGAA